MTLARPWARQRERARSGLWRSKGFSAPIPQASSWSVFAADPKRACLWSDRLFSSRWFWQNATTSVGAETFPKEEEGERGRRGKGRRAFSSHRSSSRSFSAPRCWEPREPVMALTPSSRTVKAAPAQQLTHLPLRCLLSSVTCLLQLPPWIHKGLTEMRQLHFAFTVLPTKMLPEPGCCHSR